MIFKQREKTIHKAVIENDLDLLKQLATDPHQLKKRDHLGFTAIEIAKLLGRDRCEAVLSNDSRIRTIHIQPRGIEETHAWSKTQFENFFGMRYLSHLHFANYDKLKEVLANCPLLLRFPWTGKENQEYGEKYFNQIENSYVADVEIKWVNEEIGYGLFARETIREGAYVGQYTGIVRQLYRLNPDPNRFCFHYPTRFWSWKYFVIDALLAGNELRFINHSPEPTLQPICAVDRGLLHLCFLASHTIPKGKELTFDYGPDFWKQRKIFA